MDIRRYSTDMYFFKVTVLNVGKNIAIACKTFTGLYFECNNQRIIGAGEMKFGLEIDHEHTYVVRTKCCL